MSFPLPEPTPLSQPYWDALKDGRPDTGRKLFDQSYSLFVRGESEVGWDGEALINLRAPVGATPGYAVVPVLRAMGVATDAHGSRGDIDGR